MISHINNYCLRRLAFALKISDKEIVAIFALVNYRLQLNELKGYLKKEDDALFVPIPDYLFILFLDGLIGKYRGIRKEDMELRQAQRVKQAKSQKLSNNLILNKLKIALTLTSDALIELLALADFRISKGEMSAFFRKPTHRNYRQCGNQLIRNLLTGITQDLQSDKPIIQLKTN